MERELDQMELMYLALYLLLKVKPINASRAVLPSFSLSLHLPLPNYFFLKMVDQREPLNYSLLTCSK